MLKHTFLFFIIIFIICLNYFNYFNYFYYFLLIYLFWEGTKNSAGKVMPPSKLTPNMFPLLGEHWLQYWDILEFYYMELVVWAAEIILSLSKTIHCYLDELQLTAFPLSLQFFERED